MWQKRRGHANSCVTWQDARSRAGGGGTSCGSARLEPAAREQAEQEEAEREEAEPEELAQEAVEKGEAPLEGAVPNEFAPQRRYPPPKIALTRKFTPHSASPVGYSKTFSWTYCFLHIFSNVQNHGRVPFLLHSISFVRETKNVQNANAFKIQT